MQLDSVPRLRLATVFVFVACAAIGLATTREVFAAVRPAIEAAMIVGLLQQAWELIRWRRHERSHESEERFAVAFAVAWRIMVAVGMAIFVIWGLARWSNPILSPKRDQLLFYESATVVFDLLPTIVLANSVRRWRWTDRSKSNRRYAWMLIGLLVLLPTSLVIIDGRLVDYLSHKALAETEASITRQFQRPGVYPDHASEGYQSFWLSVAASLSVAVGAGCLIQIAARRESRAGLAYGTVFVICLGLQLFYCQWFYGTEFYRVSPELAGAGLAVQLGDIPAVAVLLVLFTIALAYCLSTVTREKVVVSQSLVDQLDRRALHETAPCLIVMGLGAVAEFGALLVGLLHQAVYPIFPNLSPGMRVWFGLTLLLNPNILLVSTQLFFVFQLCYVRWRRRQEVVEWELPKLSATSLAANWIAVLVAVLTGVPTLSAFGFLFWTSPFNVFGM